MYVRSLRVQNVKLLRDVHIDFVDANGSPRMWTVFVGENQSTTWSVSASSLTTVLP